MPDSNNTSSHPTGLKNELGLSKSPYLLQHSEQKIAWQPWGKKAFELAQQLNRPVFLSVGYSTCHWCHVMSSESFEDDSIASFLNEAFVCIKVDKEERPDVDALYMDAVQMMTRQGGWPLNVILTPEGEPYFGGSYFPAEAKNGQPGFKQVLIGGALAFEKDPASLKEKAQKVFRYLESRGKDFSPRNLKLEPSFEQRTSSVYFDFLEPASTSLEEKLLEGADFVHGGFGMHLKFPSFPKLAGLSNGGSEKAKAHRQRTLRRMVTGGIFDQLEGGICRYSTDAEWGIPHFEKMLIDNAQLLEACSVEANFEEKQSDLLKSYAKKTDSFLQEVLFDKNREVYLCGQDADSDGGEGAYYYWSKEELSEALNNESSSNEENHKELLRFCQLYFGVSGTANSENGFVLKAPESEENFAADAGYTLEQVQLFKKDSIEKLIAYKQRNRSSPQVDSQAVLSSNATLARSLMISGVSLSNKDIFNRGLKLTNRLLSRYFTTGKISRIWFDNETATEGDANLDDCAALLNCLSWAASFTGEKSYLKAFQFVAQYTFLEFFDPANGTLFTTKKVSDLPVRLHKIEESTSTSAHTHIAEAILMQKASLELFEPVSEDSSAFEKSLAKDKAETWEPLLTSALGSVSLVAREIPGSCPVLLALLKRNKAAKRLVFNCHETTLNETFEELCSGWAEFLQLGSGYPIGFQVVLNSNSVSGRENKDKESSWSFSDGEREAKARSSLAELKEIFTK